jgi:hypothetical protein
MNKNRLNIEDSPGDSLDKKDLTEITLIWAKKPKLLIIKYEPIN